VNLEEEEEEEEEGGSLFAIKAALAVSAFHKST